MKIMSVERQNYLWKCWNIEMFENGSSDYRKNLNRDEYLMVNTWDGEYADSHNCRAEADAYGICSVCGAIIPGSCADHDLHGY